MPTDVNELSFPAVQTYSSGEEVAWIEETPEGGDEPEPPMPTLELAPADGSDNAAAAPADDDGDSDTLSIVALVVGVVGLVVAFAAVVLARRSQRPHPA